MEEKIKQIVEFAKKDKDVLAVALFGSYARGEKYKDIDVCLFLNKKMTNKEMTNKLIKYSGRFNNKFDISIYSQLPVYIKVKILKDVKILYCNDEDLLYEIAFDAIKTFDNYKKLYLMYLNEVENGKRKNIIKI